jgi:hypothetical protein
MKNTTSKSRGYTLLFSVLTATLVLGVAVFILGVAKKQLALSVAARDSTFAIYAADSALECTIGSLSGISSSTGGSISCDGSVAGPFGGFKTETSFPYPSILQIDIKQIDVNVLFQDSTCAKVIITMGRMNDTFKTPVTVVDSRGYNYCDSAGAPDATNPRIVERALRFTQKGTAN